MSIHNFLLHKTNILKGIFGLLTTSLKTLTLVMEALVATFGVTGQSGLMTAAPLAAMPGRQLISAITVHGH